VRSTLAPGEVHVRYRVTDTMEEADIASAASMLSPDEHARYARLMFERDRRDYSAAHALLRTSLSRYADVAPRQWTFRTDACGKPRRRWPRTRTAPVFVQPVAHPRPRRAPLWAEPTSGSMWNRSTGSSTTASRGDSFPRAKTPTFPVRSQTRSARGALRSTLKEAYVKAIGQGLSHPLNTIAFAIGDDDTIAFTPPSGVDARGWRFRPVAPTARHHLAVAVRQPDSRLSQSSCSQPSEGRSAIWSMVTSRRIGRGDGRIQCVVSLPD
jgi:4'-phosphopantetheinyl transferase